MIVRNIFDKNLTKLIKNIKICTNIFDINNYDKNRCRISEET